jgi:hypothetical protein
LLISKTLFTSDLTFTLENIGYEDLLESYPYDGELIDGIADLILETDRLSELRPD